MPSLAGRRATIDYADLHAKFLRHQEMNRKNRTDFEFDPMSTTQRHTWHGKKCTILAREGGVVRIDGLQTPYELVPVKHIRLDDEVEHGH